LSVLRSTLFLLTQVIVTVPYGVLTLFTWPLPPHVRYRIITFWSRMIIWLARLICGIRWQVRGLRNLPAGPAVVMSKHQSAWETMALQLFFPPLSIVLKKELLRIPFFGWGLAMFNPIAIDRNAGRGALRQIEMQGREKMAEGFWVLVFPEGTRMAPGNRGKYNIGGAWLAARTGAPVVPVAHDAGRFWGRNAFLKRPGRITVSIGPAIETSGLDANEVNRRVEDWIEREMQRISAG
jgi:1-acyl-sn-glycerol-3-phosphate acyltransferase